MGEPSVPLQAAGRRGRSRHAPTAWSGPGASLLRRADAQGLPRKRQAGQEHTPSVLERGQLNSRSRENCTRGVLCEFSSGADPGTAQLGRQGPQGD